MAYGARLESVLGATPREFESRILRHDLPVDVTVAVLTRINVYLFREQPFEDRSLLHRRLDLFERWTIPSVRAQTSPVDQWVIFVDERTHPEDVARMQAAVEGLPTTFVTMASRYEPKDYYDTISRALHGDAEWLVTCRLDSDDALGRDYTRHLRAAARETPGEFLNFERGWKLAGKRLRQVVDASNPFLAYMEPTSTRPRTVFHVKHHEAATSAPVRQIAAEPMWLMNIHDHNMLSTLSGKRVSRRRLRHQFPWARSARILA